MTMIILIGVFIAGVIIGVIFDLEHLKYKIREEFALKQLTATVAKLAKVQFTSSNKEEIKKFLEDHAALLTMEDVEILVGRIEELKSDISISEDALKQKINLLPIKQSLKLSHIENNELINNKTI